MEKEKSFSVEGKILFFCLVVCFFLSGAVALVYQTLWMRMLTIVFGNSSYAVSTVLCGFMAGLGLGSWYFGKKVDSRPKMAILLYAVLEIGIAVCAFAVPYALIVTDKIHVAAYSHLAGSAVTLNLLRFVLAIAILIIPTTLMGGTLPVLARFFVRRREKVGAGIGALYAVNTFGAMVGCFLTGFYLIGLFGVSRTLLWCVVANFLIGIFALILNHLIESRPDSANIGIPPDSLDIEPATETAQRQEAAPGSLRIILLFAALAGMTSLAYEVFWTRVLVFYMNNSVYAFSSMLVTMLFGLALGGYLFGKILDRQQNLWQWLAMFQLGIGIWAVFAFPVIGIVFDRFGDTSKLFQANFWGVPVYVKLAKVAMLMLFPTLLMGATFPLLNKLYNRNIKDLGKSVGSIYSRNTLGSMVGAFGAGFILIPLLGIQKGVIAVAVVNIVMALWAMHLNAGRALRKKLAFATMTILAVISIAATPKEMLFKRCDEEWTRLLFYEEDNTATVKVYTYPSGEKGISINGYEVAGGYASLEEIQKALAHYPALLHNNPESVLVVGFGAGGTSWSMTRHNVKEIDLVEIVPAVLKAASYLTDINHGVINAPNFKATIDDGRNYIHATDKTYDIITVDSVDPKHAGNGNLYSVDFYEDCLAKLNDGGIMAEWIPYHLLSEREFKIILNSFSTVFPETQLWFTPLYSYFILIGSQDEIVIDYSLLAERMSNPELLQDFSEIGVYNPAMFVSSLAMDKAGIEHYLGGATEVNTYDRPRIEFFGEYSHTTFGELPVYTPMGEPKVVNLDYGAASGISQKPALAYFRKAARETIKARYYFTHKDYSKATYHAQRMLALDPHYPAAKYVMDIMKPFMNEDLEGRLAYLRDNPNNPESYFSLGDFYEKAQKLDVAIEMYKKAIEIEPDFERAYNNLGLIYGNKGEFDKALGIFEIAQKINPLSPTAAYNIGVVYYLKGDYQAAERICREALRMPFNDVDTGVRDQIQGMLRNLSRVSLNPETKRS